MASLKQPPFSQWTRLHASILAVACLSATVVSAKSSNIPAPTLGGAHAATQPDPVQLKAAADMQSAPLIDRLKSGGENPQLLTEVGNIYYDAQQYPVAVDFYRRALKVKPADAAVRTDMATAYWFMGNADLAIAEFDKALAFVPDNPNTLFNRGLVKWKGKKDAAGALADWERLLAIDPAYDQKDKVRQMIAEVKQR